MTTALPKRSNTINFLFYGLALLLVLLSPALGVLVAAVATWHALLAGSFWYMPLGVVLLLAAIAMVQNHKLFDLVFLGVVILTVIAWFGADSLQQRYLLEGVHALLSQTHLMAGVLATLIVALVLIHIARRHRQW